MLTREEFTKQFYPVAVKVTKGSGIFPETLLAMAIVESSALVNGISLVGANAAARLANNYFGIKADLSWKGQTVRLNTPKDNTPTSLFRYYSSVNESFKDYVNFLKKNPRYIKANVFNSPDYATQIINIARAGYAEAVNYAEVVKEVADKVVKVIEKNLLKPLNNNKGLAGAFTLFFLSLIIYKYKNNVAKI
jgi:flagellum-specific peptidoglycan hydrolase FlgJ